MLKFVDNFTAIIFHIYTFKYFFPIYKFKYFLNLNTYWPQTEDEVFTKDKYEN